MSRVKIHERVVKYRQQVCERCSANAFCQIQQAWKDFDESCPKKRWDKAWEKQELENALKERVKSQKQIETQRILQKKYRKTENYNKYMRDYMAEYQRRPEVKERRNARARERWRLKKEEALQNVAV